VVTRLEFTPEGLPKDNAFSYDDGADLRRAFRGSLTDSRAKATARSISARSWCAGTFIGPSSRNPRPAVSTVDRAKASVDPAVGAPELR
jgi:hypothetical protein